MGHDPTWLERDLASQRLAAFVWQAGEDELVCDAPEEIASRVAKQLGYAFESARDIYDPTIWDSWVEHREPILQMARTLAQGPERDTELAHENAASVASTAAQEVLDAVQSSQGYLARLSARLRFRLLLHLSREAVDAESRMSKVHALALSALRLRVLELGRKLEESKAISSANDIFHLTPDEILRVHCRMNEAEITSLRKTLAERKHKLWLQRRLDPPMWLPLGAGPNGEDSSPAQNRVLVGNPISRGEIIGSARIANKLEEALLLQPGEVLVAEDLLPAWTPLLSIASGLVMQKGQTLCQGAMAARNYGIPCVSEVSGAMSVLRTGQLIRVDGTNGTVEVLKRRS
jgi:pyruvate,water dikinase